MKKFIYILCFSLLALTACKKEESTFEVAVQLKGMPDGVRAFINLTDEKGRPTAIDTIIVQNEQAVFKGAINVPEMAYLKVNGTKSNFPFILEKGKINIEFFKDSVTSSIIHDGKYNKEYQEFLNESRVLRDKMLAVRKELGEKTREKDTANIPLLKQKLTDIQTEVKNYQIDYIESHPDGFITPILLERSLHSKSLSEDRVLTYYNALSENMRKTAAAKNIAKSIVIGTKATFFSAPDPEGNIISLDDVKGKVTIIDFWASWCGPCRKENPNVVEVYKKYHDKGLNIIGVSLDGSSRQKDAKKAWLDAIEKDGLTWSHVSNLKHWKEPIAKIYNVRSIPATFILDENGIIVAKNVRGANLEPKIKELLGL